MRARPPVTGLSALLPGANAGTLQGRAARVTSGEGRAAARRRRGGPGSFAADVASLSASIEALAARADRVHRYLAEHDPAAVRARMAVEAASDDTARGRLAEALGAQLDALGRLRAQLDRLLAEMDRVTVALQAIHAEVLGMAAAEAGWQGRELSSRVGDLQVKVGVLGDGLDEVYAETRVSIGGG